VAEGVHGDPAEEVDVLLPAGVVELAPEACKEEEEEEEEEAVEWLGRGTLV
jgi:hypothetical protein